MTVSAGGSASAHLVSSPTLDNLAGQPVTAMAAIPGTDRALLAGGGTVLTLDLSASPPVVEAFPASRRRSLPSRTWVSGSPRGP